MTKKTAPDSAPASAPVPTPSFALPSLAELHEEAEALLEPMSEVEKAIVQAAEDDLLGKFRPQSQRALARASDRAGEKAAALARATGGDAEEAFRSARDAAFERARARACQRTGSAYAARGFVRALRAGKL